LPKDYFFFVAFFAAFLAGAFFAAFFVAMVVYSPLFRFPSSLQHECCSYGMYMVLQKLCQEKNAKQPLHFLCGIANGNARRRENFSFADEQAFLKSEKWMPPSGECDS
jgi:hypothetical protein